MIFILLLRKPNCEVSILSYSVAIDTHHHTTFVMQFREKSSLKKHNWMCDAMHAEDKNTNSMLFSRSLVAQWRGLASHASLDIVRAPQKHFSSAKKKPKKPLCSKAWIDKLVPESISVTCIAVLICNHTQLSADSILKRNTHLSDKQGFIFQTDGYVML